MPKVTALEVQKRNKERVNVYLDGEFAFGLSLMEAAQLRKGQELTDSDIASLRDEDAIVQAVEQGIRFLSYRPRSVREVRQNLEKKKLPELVVESAIERLVSKGYVDDHSFARFWVENRNMFKPLGPRALRFELRQKGVSDSIINELLEELVDAEAAAMQAARRKIRSHRGRTRQVFKQKLGAFLQRRGFSYDTVQRVLEQLIRELEGDDESFFAEADEYE